LHFESTNIFKNIEECIFVIIIIKNSIISGDHMVFRIKDRNGLKKLSITHYEQYQRKIIKA